MSDINNKRGFTLIELLAVIVVLAIVMVVAVNAVMPRLAEGRKQSFATEANAAIEAANVYFMNSNLLGGTSTTKPADGSDLTLPTSGSACVTVTRLIEEGFFDADVETYKGRVIVEKKGNLYVYAVSLRSPLLMVRDEGFKGNFNKDVTSEVVQDYDATDFGNRETCTGYGGFPTQNGITN